MAAVNSTFPGVRTRWPNTGELQPWLLEVAKQAVNLAEKLQQPVTGSISVALPGWPKDLLDRLIRSTPKVPTAVQQGFYGAHPVRGLRVAAWGCVAQLTATGTQQVTTLAGLLREASASQVWVNQPPRWFGGFAFASGPRQGPWQNWPDAQLILPRLSWTSVQNRTWLTVNLAADPAQNPQETVARAVAAYESLRTGSGDGESCGLDRIPQTAARHLTREVTSQPPWRVDLEHGTFVSGVEQCVAEICAGEYEKVVLARREQIKGTSRADLSSAVRALEQVYPDSFTYVLRQGDDWFVGASPEQLVRVVNGELQADCLAGTAPRGRDEESDEKFAQGLLNSAKNRHEHAIVKTWIFDRLADVTSEIHASDAPSLRKLTNVQHLHTPIRGRLYDSVSVLDVAARLHPTPAVAGVPQGTAMEAVLRRESFDRGWYAGGVGWADAEGNGEFFVALRSALLLKTEAWLYAGAGIVNASNGEEEWAETELKLAPMRTALARQKEGSGSAGK